MVAISHQPEVDGYFSHRPEVGVYRDEAGSSLLSQKPEPALAGFVSLAPDLESGETSATSANRQVGRSGSWKVGVGRLGGFGENCGKIVKTGGVRV